MIRSEQREMRPLSRVLYPKAVAFSNSGGGHGLGPSSLCCSGGALRGYQLVCCARQAGEDSSQGRAARPAYQGAVVVMQRLDRMRRLERRCSAIGQNAALGALGAALERHWTECGAWTGTGGASKGFARQVGKDAAVYRNSGNAQAARAAHSQRPLGRTRTGRRIRGMRTGQYALRSIKGGWCSWERREGRGGPGTQFAFPRLPSASSVCAFGRYPALFPQQSRLRARLRLLSGIKEFKVRGRERW